MVDRNSYTKTAEISTLSIHKINISNNVAGICNISIHNMNFWQLECQDNA